MSLREMELVILLPPKFLVMPLFALIDKVKCIAKFCGSPCGLL